MTLIDCYVCAWVSFYSPRGREAFTRGEAVRNNVMFMSCGQGERLVLSFMFHDFLSHCIYPPAHPEGVRSFGAPSIGF
eukprot:6078000-Pyramimonas_sp.AAC.1